MIPIIARHVVNALFVIKIQKIWRGYWGRLKHSEYVQRVAAATLIQKIARGARQYREYTAFMTENKRLIQPAITAQRYARRYVNRNMTGTLLGCADVTHNKILLLEVFHLLLTTTTSRGVVVPVISSIETVSIESSLVPPLCLVSRTCSLK